MTIAAESIPSLIQDAEPHPAESFRPEDCRVLTIYQPWATLLAAGIKKIETRSRPFNFNGLLFIHAGLWLDDLAIGVACCHQEYFRAVGIDVSADDWWLELPRGFVVGAVRMVRSVATEELIEDGHVSALERGLGDYTVERQGWVCECPVLFKHPIACRGGQGPRFLAPNLFDRCLAELVRCTNPVQRARLLAPA